MRLRAIILPVAFIAACSDGPETPYSYDSPAVELTFSVDDGPISSEPVSGFLRVHPVSYRPEVEPLGFDDCTGPHATLDSVFNYPRFDVPSFRAAHDDYQSTMCGHRDPAALHFFKVWVVLIVGGVGGGFWGPGPYDLVYAPATTEFRPFGPSGPAVSIPKGYSWLHRTCGAMGDTEFSVVSTESTVELRRVKEGLAGSVKATEEDLVAACHVQLPPIDLGIRVAFDRAQQLIWSADDSSLYYLSMPEEQDPLGKVGVRQVRLAEQVVSELVALPGAVALQTGADGVLYVTGAEKTYAVTVATGAPATLQQLFYQMEFPHLSPDGLWVAYDFSGKVHLSSVKVPSEVTYLEGNFVAWSPDSRLVYGPARPQAPPTHSPSAQQPYSLFSVSPATPDSPVPCGSVSAELLSGAGTLAWASECPQLAYAPQNWSIESSIPTPDCENCFGLAIQDPVAGTERTVLDASAGLIRQPSMRPNSDFVFAWARTCRGLYNTVCSYSLLRVRVADGTVETVAIADEELPVALSWDGRRLALAAANGIYVKDLPP